jgi:hypothetical protein
VLAEPLNTVKTPTIMRIEQILVAPTWLSSRNLQITTTNTVSRKTEHLVLRPIDDYSVLNVYTELDNQFVEKFGSTAPDVKVYKSSTKIETSPNGDFSLAIGVGVTVTLSNQLAHLLSLTDNTWTNPQ